MFRWTLILAMALLACLLMVGCSSDDDGGSTTPPASLNAPSGLHVVGVGMTTVQLQWTDNATDEDAYYVERSMSNNQAYQQVAALGANVVTHTDTGLVTGQRYYYRVRAGRGTTFSAYSNETSTDVVPSGPSITVLTPNGDEHLAIGLEYEVTWSSYDVTGGVDILLSTDGGSNWPYTIASNVPNVFTYSWTVSPAMEESETSRLRIRSHDSTHVRDDSDGNFHMYEAWVADTTNQAGDFYDVAFADLSNGWACGGSGLMVHTTNGGAQWVQQGSQVTGNIHQMFALTADTAWFVGASGVIRRTTNGGSLWSQQTSGTSVDLGDVVFTDGLNGWVVGVGGAVRHTTNGGTSWASQSSGVTTSLNGVDFVDAENGWAVGANGVVRHTTNGGTNWTGQTSGVTSSLRDVDFVNATHGWAVGNNCVIRHTTDGGESWVGQDYYYPGSPILWEVAFTDENHGMIVGDFGIILHTVDGGETWTEQYSGLGVTLRALSFPDALNGWVAGYYPAILHTTTGGH